MDHRNALDNNSLSIFGKEVVSDNVKALLGCAIVATIFTVCPKPKVISCVYWHVLAASLKFGPQEVLSSVQTSGHFA